MKFLLLMVSLSMAMTPAMGGQRGSTPKVETPVKPSSASASAPDSPTGTAVFALRNEKGSTSVIPAFGADQPLESKVIRYGEKDVVSLRTKLRYTTLIILPKNEKILDFSCGDKEFWVVEGSENFAYVKPAKTGAQTNLNLITASGNIYSFALAEVSETPNVEPDVKVFVELKDDSMISATKGPPRFFTETEIDKYRQEAEAAKKDAIRAKQITDEALEKGVGKILSSVRCGYQFKKNEKPFYVSTICHDDKQTYLSMAPEETPTLYELRDGPNLVNFTYQPFEADGRPNAGILVVQKVIHRGYIAIGKKRLQFSIPE
jgi:type IV secretion system protein VirB9